MYVEAVSDLLDYSRLQIKVFWGKQLVLDEFTIDDFLLKNYTKKINESDDKKYLVEALLLTREILAESSGDLELVNGDEVSGFILRLPRYSPAN